MRRIFFDGASRGNPGPGAAAAVLEGGDEHAARVSEGYVTNNVAEFHGLILAIGLAKKLGLEEVEFVGDSQLIVRLVEGRYKANNENMKMLLDIARKRLSELPKWSIRWVPREQNFRADRLCNEYLEQRSGL